MFLATKILSGKTPAEVREVPEDLRRYIGPESAIYFFCNGTLAERLTDLGLAIPVGGLAQAIEAAQRLRKNYLTEVSVDGTERTVNFASSDLRQNKTDLIEMLRDPSIAAVVRTVAAGGTAPPLIAIK